MGPDESHSRHGASRLPSIELKPILVRTGHRDRDGRLALADGELVAVLVRLDDPIHGADQGRWFLEAGFGLDSVGRLAPVFNDLDAAADWIDERVRRNPAPS